MNIRILLISSNPTNTNKLRVDKEFREIQETLEKGEKRRNISVTSRSAIREKDLRDLLIREKPHIVHFSGHGVEGGIYLEDDSGYAKLASIQGLRNLLSIIESLHCVVLNACFTENIALELNKSVPYVIGISSEIKDDEAINFSKGFYSYLSYNYDIDKAFSHGKNSILINENYTDKSRSLDLSNKRNFLVKIFIGKKNISLQIYNILSSKNTYYAFFLILSLPIIIYFLNILFDEACPSEQIIIDDITNLNDEVYKITSGKYVIGKGSNGFGNHERAVSLQKYYIDKYEVTNKQFKEFKSGWEYPVYRDYYPVTNINWETAKSYCLSLGKDLPTANEWEVACRYGSTHTDNYRKKSCKITQVGAHFKNKKLNILNLSNNVSEWTRDVAVVQDSTKRINKIVKGGNFLDVELLCHDKLNYQMQAETDEVGFRCVKY